MKKFIDVDKIIASKNPRLQRLLPGFLLRYIRRILHEEEINGFFRDHGHNRGLQFAETVLREFHTTVHVKGLENIPENGGFIVAANHPLGGFDGLALMHAVAKKRKDIKFLVNDILLNLTPLENIFVPVNKHGSQYAVSLIEETYQSDNAVLIFPAGLVSRKQNGNIRDLRWKKSFISKAIQYQKPVVPTYVEGRNSGFFYNLARWRKRFKIKANLEMFYLPDEMYRQRDKTITVIFGRAVSPDVFDRTKSHREWAALMQDHVYALGEGTAKSFNQP
ncbi:MAG TPA: 1-acyl-sn-glycerol-3-phosphate acyltransferase [Bacteroidia bacterium]|nr:1-acyl-sn-glycerol-3-phosphate acyltransferase [Bacteroidia bacterium]